MPPSSRSTQQFPAPNRPTFRRRPIGDFKMDTTATVPDATKPADPSPAAKAAEPKPAETVTAPAANDAVTAAPPAATATCAGRRTRQGAGESQHRSLRLTSRSPTVLRDMLGAKSLRYFDRKNERAAVEKFYTRATTRRNGRRPAN
jgi:hypothetical protein